MIERWAAASDLHVPFQDHKAFGVFLSFLKAFRPRKVFLCGDLCDMYPTSKFARDPARAFSLQSDLDSTVEYLYAIREAVPKSALVFVPGNHEGRLKQYLWGTAPALASLRDLTVEGQLHLSRLHIEYIADSVLSYGDATIRHGYLCRKQAGAAAIATLIETGTSSVSSHTHRLAQVYKKMRSGTFVAIETGCLCSLTPEYLTRDGREVDWINGFAWGYLVNGRLYPSLAPIIDGIAIINGQVVRGS